jgi:LPXTG-motif cell wall-anchored protein
MSAPLLADTASTLGTVLLAQDDGFIGSPLFFVLGGVVVAALLGLLWYMRKKDSDD